MSGGRCPPEVEPQFIVDVLAGMSEPELAGKYKRHVRTIAEWKRKLRDEAKLEYTTEHRERRHSVDFQEKGNHAHATSQSERIKTLEQLLEAVEVDLSVWKVRDWGVKKWEVGAKIRHSDLRFSEGAIDGWVKDEGLGVTDLWSVWAKFVRIELIALHAAIQPVQCQVTCSRPGRPARDGVGRSLLGGDLQIGYRRNSASGKLVPFHDRLALDLFLQVAAYTQPESIVLGGDIQDFPNMQDKFLREPDFAQTTQPAIEEAHWWSRQLREACPDAEIVYVAGNHDKRLRSSVLTHLRAAYDLRPADELELPPPLSPERLMGLSSLGIEWIGDYPNGEHWLTERLRVIHGDRISQAGGGTAQAILKDADDSTVFFHAHRREMASKSVHSRRGIRAITVFSPGCLCRVDGKVPGKKKRQNWQQGMAIVEFTETGQSSYVIEIQDGTAVWDRRVFRAADRVEDLRRDMPGWNW